MHIGISASCTDQGLHPSTLARMAEEAGLECVAFGEHSHMPAVRQASYPGGDGTLPAGYERTLDLFVVLACAAVATSAIRVGTSICQIVQRDPILTAKEVASIDAISGGRMTLLTGAGWNVEEMRNHGTDPATRYELLEERVLAMREIWANDEASFHGRFVDFERIWSWPKPVQDPMPVWIGGNSDGVEERARRVGTGWAPLHRPDIPDRVRAYLQRAREDGVAPSVTVVGGPLSAELIEEYTEAGVERWLHSTRISADEAEFADKLERLLEVQAEFAAAP